MRLTLHNPEVVIVNAKMKADLHMTGFRYYLQKYHLLFGILFVFVTVGLFSRVNSRHYC